MMNKVNISLVVGGFMDRNRIEDSRRGVKPRVDVFEMMQTFPALMYDFHWLEEEAKTNPRVRFLVRLFRRWIGWSACLGVCVCLAAKPGDIVYATGEDVGLPMAALLRLLGKKRPFLVMRLEQPACGRTPFRRQLYDLFFSFAIQRVRIIFCRAKMHKDYLNKHFNIPNTRIEFFSEPVDCDFYNKNNVKEEISINNRPLIVSAGLEMRDYESLLKAVDGLDIDVIIGAGSPWSKFRFDRNKNLPNNVRVDQYGPIQMRKLYAQSDLVVVSIRPTMRTCGISVVLESSAMERPVIASATEGLQEYICDGETGFLVEPGRPEVLRQKIIDLLGRPAEARRVAQNGRQRAMNCSRVESYVAYVHECILRLV